LCLDRGTKLIRKLTGENSKSGGLYFKGRRRYFTTEKGGNLGRRGRKR